MIINKIKVKGYDIDAIFVGDKYYFNSIAFGVLAIAERVSDVTLFEKFKIRIGNQHTIGISIDPYALAPHIKRFITRKESQYVKTKVEYEIVDEDMSQTYLTIKENNY
jgi:hypothetical protein